MASVNQVAEYLLVSVENKQEMKLNLSKLNITDKICIDVVERELNELRIHIELEGDSYEEVIFRFDMFIDCLNKDNFVYFDSRDF